MSEYVEAKIFDADNMTKIAEDILAEEPAVQDILNFMAACVLAAGHLGFAKNDLHDVTKKQIDLIYDVIASVAEGKEENE